MGCLRVDALRANRMPQRWRALDAGAQLSADERQWDVGEREADRAPGAAPADEHPVSPDDAQAPVDAHAASPPDAPRDAQSLSLAADPSVSQPEPSPAQGAQAPANMSASTTQVAAAVAGHAGNNAAHSGADFGADVVFDARALPFFEESLDLVVLPHTLEFSPDPHACLREVARVLVNEGRVVISGINPLSLWGARQWRGHLWRRLGGGDLYLPEQGEFISPWRVADWLRLLGFAVGPVHYGCWRATARTQRGMARLAWMDDWGERLWPVLGAAYCVTAVKRTASVTLMGKPWREVPRSAEVRVTTPRTPAPQSSALRRDVPDDGV
jgi:SAM-dependent methyltransferase